MVIQKPAIAGTLESSDCMVTVEPGEGKIDLDLDSAVIRQYGKQIRKVILETLQRLDVTDAKIWWTRELWTAPSKRVWNARSTGPTA